MSSKGKSGENPAQSRCCIGEVVPIRSLERKLWEGGERVRTPKSEYLPVYGAHETSSRLGGCSSHGEARGPLLYPF